jgi:hypothetical protein
MKRKITKIIIFLKNPIQDNFIIILAKTTFDGLIAWFEDTKKDFTPELYTETGVQFKAEYKIYYDTLCDKLKAFKKYIEMFYPKYLE